MLEGAPSIFPDNQPADPGNMPSSDPEPGTEVETPDTVGPGTD